MYHVQKPYFLIIEPFSLRSTAKVSLKVFANRKPTTGCGLNFLYSIKVSYFCQD